MELNEYQDKAMSTCMPTCDNLSYMMLNLVAEVGELAGKIAKDIRKGNIVIKDNVLCVLQDENGEWLDRLQEYKKELGDIFWQAVGVATSFGWTAEEVAQGNLEKLTSRHQRGVIDGDGDNR